MKITLKILFSFLILFPFNAHAEFELMGEGLAMHGAPKYTVDAPHLDYVNPEAPKKGTLRQAVIGTFDSLNPFALKGKAAQGLHLAYDRLMQRVWDEPFTLYPLVARRAEVSSDRSSITFEIDALAKFNNGEPITVDDVIFSYETLKDEGRPNMRRVYQLAKTVEKIGKDKVKFTFGEGYDQETAMIFAMMPVLSKNYWQERTFDSSTLDIPVSSGPYKIKEVEPGRKIVYERDRTYWARDKAIIKGQNNFDRLIYDYFRDDTVALEAFQKGLLDIRREYDISKWETAYRVSKEFEKRTFDHGRPVRIDSLIFNTRKKPFDDIRVRKALNYAFDENWVNKNLYFGKLKRIKSFYENSELEAPKTNGLWQPPANMSMRERLKKADELLNEAGIKVIDGKRILPDRSHFSFEILSNSPENEKTALNFANTLKRLGIRATIRTLDTAAFRDRLNSYDFDMVMYYWQNSLSPGTEQYLYWSCTAAESEGQWNFAGICDKRIDAAAQKIPFAKNREDLVSTTQTLDRLLLNHVTTIPLFYMDKDMIAVKNTIATPEKTPLYGPVIETWWVRKGSN